MRAVLATAATALLLALGPAGVAAAGVAQQGPWQQAAPEYQSSEPDDGAMLHEPPSEVRITFSEPLDPSSSIMVHDECGRQVDDKNVQVMGTDMTVGIAKTPAGVYTVMYTANGFGGITGSTEGDFSFMVHAGPACDGSSSGRHHGGEHSGHDMDDMDDMDHGGEHSGHDMDNMDDMDHMDHGEHATHDDHSDIDHSGMDMDHMDMGRSKQSHSHSHGHGHAHGHGGRHHHQASDDNDQPFAADPALPIPLEPDSQAVLAALLMALGFGVLGGWYLRTSGQR